jgi:hypothetical protein
LLSETVEFDNVEEIDIINFIVMRFNLNLSSIIRCINEKYQNQFCIEEFCKYLLDNNYTDDYFSIRSSLPQNVFNHLMNFTNKIYFVLPYRGDPKRIYVEYIC